ncbi:MAG TPA: hypothetical protein VG889_14170 [Rhizomicrobium sp.]|nr:hypothetical protein [Rhizomicrobium sp.]
MRHQLEQFAQDWVSDNVHNIPGLSEAADLDREVARLKTKFITDAATRGIPAKDLEAAVGDFDDFLTAAYENVHDPELGFKD